MRGIEVYGVLEAPGGRPFQALKEYPASGEAVRFTRLSSREKEVMDAVPPVPAWMAASPLLVLNDVRGLE